MSNYEYAADSRLKEATPAPDKLLTFREVGERIGLACRTSHTARALAARGQLVAVRINERVVRFTESSVAALIAGRVDQVAAPRRSPASKSREAATAAEMTEADCALINGRADLSDGAKRALCADIRSGKLRASEVAKEGTA